MKNLITHNSVFHHDDAVGAGIMLDIFPNINIIRTRDLDKLSILLRDKDSLILDVGMDYDPDYHNYDHHHDANLPSSAGLIWEHFGKKWISLKTSMMDKIDDIHERMKTQIINSVDAFDTNRYGIFKEVEELNTKMGFNIPTLNRIVSGFNRMDMGDDVQNKQFELAARLCSSVLENELRKIEADIRSEEEFNNAIPVKLGKIKFTIFGSYNNLWRKLYDERGIHIAIQPYFDEGFQINSSNPESHFDFEFMAEQDGHIFTHRTGFMSRFKSEEQALTACINFLKMKDKNEE